MKLEEFLKTMTDVGDFVIFYLDGWQYGGTIIDSEDLFLISLNPLFLERNVIEHSKEANNNKSIVKVFLKG